MPSLKISIPESNIKEWKCMKLHCGGFNFVQMKVLWFIRFNTMGFNLTYATVGYSNTIFTRCTYYTRLWFWCRVIISLFFIFGRTFLSYIQPEAVMVVDLQLPVQSVYHHYRCAFEPRSWRGVLDTTLCDKVCLICDRSVDFSEYSVYSTNKTDRHDI